MLVSRKGMTKKGNEILYSEPGTSCPEHVSELLKKLVQVQDLSKAKAAIL